MSSTPSPHFANQYATRGGLWLTSSARVARLHVALATALLCYAAAFSLWTALRPFGRDDLRFLAVSDIGGAIPPLTAAAIGFMASRRCAGRPRLGWLLLALGWLSWGLGESAWAVYEVILRVETPFPSVVDVGYLGAIPLMLAGVVMLMPRESNVRHYADVASAAATSLVGAALIWHFVVRDTFAQSDVALLQKTLSAAYPFADLLLLAVLALALQKVWRGVAGIILAVLFAGLLAFLTADLVFAYLDLNDRYTSGNLVTDPAWVVGFLLMVYAAGLQVLFTPDYRVVLSERRRARWLRAVPALILILVGGLVAGDALGADGPFRLESAFVFVAAVTGAVVAGRVLLGLTDNVRVVVDARKELFRAAELQSTLLPSPTRSHDTYELAARYLPARDLGGDFYDWWEQPVGTLHIAFGDVMGKGMAAALLMASMRTALRASSAGVDASTAMERAASLMEADFTSASAFSTLFYGRLDTATRVLTYVDCGHGLSFVLTHDGQIRRLPATDLPLGTTVGPYSFQSTELRLSEGDCVFVCSDGLLDLIPDVMTPARLDALLDGARLDASQALERAVLAALDAGTPQDDITVLLLRVKSAPAGA